MKDALKNSINIKAITLEDFPLVKSTAEFLAETSARIKTSNPSGNRLTCIDNLPASGLTSFVQFQLLFYIFRSAC